MTTHVSASRRASGSLLAFLLALVLCLLRGAAALAVFLRRATTSPLARVAAFGEAHPSPLPALPDREILD